ncbi:MAG: MBL fold metallo-hydrolase [Promethearchaeota archaeon]|nr:MAG: MBL fold metallo-hydrolase [Candidatus Lokiarchaeota archaeon]
MVNRPEPNNGKKITPMNALSPMGIKFKDPLKDVHTANLLISGCGWVDTTDGVVLIDTLLSVGAGRKVFERIQGKIKYIIYTHGHGDHVGGTKAFLTDKPEIIANKYLPDRLDKYKMLAPHRARISAQQFNIPESTQKFEYIYPTKTFLGEMTISLGDKTFKLHTARAETDDCVWVYVPELNTAFIGDLMIGVGLFPNVGNPWKPTRFALDWAKTLEEIRALEPEYIFCNGGGIMYKGKKALNALNDNIEVIRALHDQIVDLINQDMHITEMIHAVKVPDHLKKSPYLKPLYSRPEFFVFNVYRWYHGYFDHNPANLLPRPEKEVKKEIFGLIGDYDKILSRARELLDKNQAQLALQVLDVLIQAEPENIEARKLRIELLKELGSNDSCLMSRNSWYFFINQDKKFIRRSKRKL